MFVVRAHGIEQGEDECLGQAYCRAIGADWNEFLRSLKERQAAHQPGEDYARWRADAEWTQIRDSWQPENDREVRAQIAALSMAQAAELAGIGRHHSYR